MRSTRIVQYVNAPRKRVYRALVDADAIARWKTSDGMTCMVHSFYAREGGEFRISLTYTAGVGGGEKTAHTDTYYGQFVELTPNEGVVEVDEFETAGPELQGKMRVTITLVHKNGGTEVVGEHEGLPPGVSIADNEMGWRMSLGKLAALVEGDV
jgi:uncharacterized protein YndB with AHSA1/START domain